MQILHRLISNVFLYIRLINLGLTLTQLIEGVFLQLLLLTLKAIISFFFINRF